MEDQIRHSVMQVSTAEQELDQALQARNDLMRRARAAGWTWRSIANAAGLTEHGVRKALDYRRDGS